VPEGRVPDSPTPTIMLNVKWHDLDRPCCRDGANGSRSALRELFNYAHVYPSSSVATRRDRGDLGEAGGVQRRRVAVAQSPLCDISTRVSTRGRPRTAPTRLERGIARPVGRCQTGRCPQPAEAARLARSSPRAKCVRSCVAGFLCIAPSDGRSYRAGAVALQ